MISKYHTMWYAYVLCNRYNIVISEILRIELERRLQKLTSINFVA